MLRFSSSRIDLEIGMWVGGYVNQSENVTRIGMTTYSVVTCLMSGSERSYVASYAATLIPGYTTVGVCRIDGKWDLKTRTVKFELAKITSACPVNMKMLSTIS